MYINREVNGKKYRNKGVLIFDNLDKENSILHDNVDKVKVVCEDKVIISDPNSGQSKYFKTIMESPLTPAGVITFYTCIPEMIEGINPEFKRRMGMIIELKPHTYNLYFYLYHLLINKNQLLLIQLLWVFPSILNIFIFFFIYI